ncbi:hydroxyacyl-ACP dehydratase HTD2-like protein with hotdog domain [Constrictibacter sp. MBR-5]|uniref:acyl dehydratase n=1 Tax=Constrictibacter sp. MBR-5 TaxID=3156467 RepID=UPI003397A850
MPKFAEIKAGDALPERRYVPTNVSLFLYNAAIWNAHRIHYDEIYTKEVEKHPAVVVDGPLQGDWLIQAVLNWLGDDGELVEFEYSNRRASYIGDTLVSGGRIESVDQDKRQAEFSLFVRVDGGEVTAPGRAVVRFRA